MVKNLYFPGGGGDQNRAKNATPEIVSLGLPPVGQISVSAALNKQSSKWIKFLTVFF